MLVPMFEHLAWADTLAAESLAALPAGTPAAERVRRLTAHVAASEHIWLARLEGRAPAHAPWPELSLPEAVALARESAAGLLAFVRSLAPERLGEVIVYRNSAGQEFRNRIGDVFAHVALHGSHHRGQLALLVRDAGATPAATDYIVWRRGADVPPAR